MAEIVASIHDHNRSGYAHGCRCGECRLANSEYQRNYRRTTRKGNLPVGPMLALFGDEEVGEIATALGVDAATIARWQLNGIPLVQADEIVISIGAHPYVVWGDAYWKANLS